MKNFKYVDFIRKCDDSPEYASQYLNVKLEDFSLEYRIIKSFVLYTLVRNDAIKTPVFENDFYYLLRDLDLKSLIQVELYSNLTRRALGLSYEEPFNRLVSNYYKNREPFKHPNNETVMFSCKLFNIKKHNGAHIKVINGILRSLQFIFKDVFILVCHSDSVSDQTAKDFYDYIQKNFPEVKFIDETALKKYKDIDMSYHFSCVGAFLEARYIRHWLFNKGVKTVGIKFNNKNALDSNFDYVIGSEIFNETKFENIKFIKLNYPFDTSHLAIIKKEFTAKERRTPMITSVSSMNRINRFISSLTDEEVIKFKSFLKNNNLVWTFIGGDQNSIQNDFKRVFGELDWDSFGSKINIVGQVENIYSYYESSTIVTYLPYIGGGGTGLASASYLEIPTIGFTPGDGSLYLDESNLVTSFSELLSELSLLIDNSIARDKVVKRNSLFFKDKLSISSFSEGLREVLL